MSSSRWPTWLMVVAWSAAAVAVAEAQPGRQTATVAVSLRVLAPTAVDGPGDGVAAAVVPGQAVRIDPGAGVRARVVSMAATQVVVSGTALRGPGGATLRVRFTCAFAGGMTVSAAEPFDCVDGVMMGLDGARVSSLSTASVAIGAELGAGDAVGLPAGVYAGRVTVTATHPAY